MSNKNVWKTNWNTNPNQNDELDPTTNYRSIRSTGNRYSRYAPNSDKNSTQSILQRAKLPKTHLTKQNNNGYGHNTYNQGLPFHTLLQEPQSTQSIHDDDKDLYSNLPTMPLDPPTQPSNRFPHNSPQPASGDKKTATPTLSSTGKWRSRRAEKLKKNPHQKHPYSSKPIPSNREYTAESSATSNTHEVSAASPTTYKDSRFTRFAQEQQQLTNHSSNTNNSSNKSSGNKKQTLVDHSSNKSTASNTVIDVVHEEEKWFYKDPSGQEQGPFSRSQMSQWFGDGYFPQDLPIRCNPATPFVQLKDWFLQGMTAFLEEIPTQWPQTNEEVIMNRRRESPQNEERITAPVVQGEDIHKTPPSSDNEEQQTSYNSRKKTPFDDEENGTNKSSVAGDDSFYDPSSTRMASIHPRPTEECETQQSVKKDISEEDKLNLIQDEAMDYYLQDSNKKKEEAEQTPPPVPTIHCAHSYHHHQTTSTNKLTPLSAYDESLAATPPAPAYPTQPQPQAHEYDEEYNYTPSTNPEHNSEEHMPLFRSNTDPTDYHHINAAHTNDIDMMQVQHSTSGPNDGNAHGYHHHYDPFGGQDLFANGRRNLTQHPVADHEIYEPRQPMKRITNETQNTAKQQRDRKPPIRHKWPQHFMATTQMQFEQMMVEQPMNVDDDAVPQQPPPVDTATTTTKKQKTRKRRKKRHRNQHKSGESNASNVWGGAGTKSKLSFMELQARDVHEQQQMKKKQREDIKRRQDVIKQQKQQQLLQQQKQQEEASIAAAAAAAAYHEAKQNSNPWHAQANVAIKSSNNVQKTTSNTKSKKKPPPPPAAAVSSSSSWSSKAKATANTKQRNNGSTTSSHNNGSSKRKSNKQSKSNRNGSIHNNKNIDAVNKVSAELQSWLRTEIKKLNADVEAASVAHLLLTLDDDTAKTTAYHTFGTNKEVNTFIDSFLVHRSHDIQQKRNNKSNHSQQKKKKRRR
eukprot:179222_1